MGIFNATLKAGKRAVIGGTIGAGTAAFTSSWDQEATIGGMWAGAAMGVIGLGMASKVFNRPNKSIISFQQKAGGGLARFGAGIRSSSKTNNNMFSGVKRLMGTGIGNVGLGVKQSAIGVNRTGNATLFALGAGSAGYIGGNLMESNRGPRRLERNRTAMYGR